MPKRLVSKVQELEQYALPVWLPECNRDGWNRLPLTTRAEINSLESEPRQKLALLIALPKSVREDVLQRIQAQNPEAAATLRTLTTKAF